VLINQEKKFVFIHVQKTAGISIESELMAKLPDTKIWHGRHGRALDGIDEVGFEEWKQYYSFAFVRNPWDRMVSWYSMIESARKNIPFYKKCFKKPFKSALWNYAINNSHDFESFVENCTDVIFDLGCYKSFAFNQIDYLTDSKGNLAVDFVGKFENINNDFTKITKHLMIEDIVLPQKNQSSHKHYSAYYNEHTIDIIKNRFERDIRAFNYEFDYREFKK
jgi:hypothetical protein